MEWMLQVVDEIDDAIGAVRLGWVGLTAPLGGFVTGMAAAFRVRRARLWA